jgi:hypothetical protein
MGHVLTENKNGLSEQTGSCEEDESRSAIVVTSL